MSGATVGDVLQGRGGEVQTTVAGVTLAQAAAKLAEKDVGILVVCDDQGDLIGVLSERDLVRAIGKRGGGALEDSIDDIVTRNVITCADTESAHAVIATMNQRRFRHMPVLHSGHIAGFVILSDLINHVFFEVEYATLQL